MGILLIRLICFTVKLRAFVHLFSEMRLSFILIATFMSLNFLFFQNFLVTHLFQIFDQTFYLNTNFLNKIFELKNEFCCDLFVTLE